MNRPAAARRWSELDASGLWPDLERHFSDPPDEFRPVPWLCYTGVRDDAQVLAAIDEMRDKGIRSFFIFPIYGIETPYLSEAWFELVRKSVERCAERGMTVWIYDDYNWPNGSCAGLLPARYPEFRMRRFHSIWSARTAPGALTRVSGRGEVAAAFAVAEDGSARDVEIDMEPEGGPETWRGSWRNKTDADAWLLVVARQTDIECSVAGRGCLWQKELDRRAYTDLLNAGASEKFVEMTHEAYYRALAPHFGKTLVGFFDDEPNIAPLPDNAELLDAFARETGRRLEDCLGELLLPGSEERYRLRATLRRLIGERFGAHMARLNDWCADHGVDSTGHYLREESPEHEIQRQGDPWLARRPMSVPGLDLLGCETSYEPPPGRRWLAAGRIYEPSGLILTAKVPAAVARYEGLARVMVEAYGVMPFWVAPADLTSSTHWLTALGANLLNDNLLTLSFEGFRKRSQAGRHFTTPWWESYGDFAVFAARCSLMSAAGRVPASVGLLYPTLTAQCLAPLFDGPSDVPQGPDRSRLHLTNRACLHAADALLRGRYDWEFVFEQLIEDAPVRDGAIAPPHSEFSVVLVPAAHALSEAVLTKLEALAESGGLVVFVGALPTISVEEGFDVAQRAARMLERKNVHLVDFAADDTWVELLPRLEPILTSRVEPAVKLLGPDEQSVLAVRRVAGDREVFHVANMSGRPVSVRAELRAAAVELWRPDDGERYAVPHERRGGAVTMRLDFAPWEGYFLVTADGAEDDLPAAPPSRLEAPPRFPSNTLAAPPTRWRTIAFPDEPWEVERSRPNMAPLRPWVRLDPEDAGRRERWADGPPDEAWTGADGDRLPFDLDPSESATMWIKCLFHADAPPADLGVVVDSPDFAEAWLNGEPLGAPEPWTLWDGANRRFALGDACRPGWNTLTFRAPVSPYYHRDVVLSVYCPSAVEPFVLVGDFSADADTIGRTLLTPPRARLRLGSWGLQGLDGYAGTITYRRTLRIDDATGEAWLDLGEVHDVAEVTLNGKPLGRRCWPPYTFRLDPALVPGDNRFEVRVTNGLGGLLRTWGWEALIGPPLGRPPSGLLGPAQVFLRE